MEENTRKWKIRQVFSWLYTDEEMQIKTSLSLFSSHISIKFRQFLKGCLTEILPCTFDTF